MKLFFLASISSDPKVKNNYRKIVDELEILGNEVLSKHSFDEPHELGVISEKELEERAKKLSKEMLKCDGLVFEGTISSTGAGFLLSQALQKGIPTLFLAQVRYSGLYLADPNRLLMIKQYNPESKKTLNEIFNKYLNFANKQILSNRFNFMMSDSMYKFISEQSKQSNISKASQSR
jgi:hypothetical protein